MAKPESSSNASGKQKLNIREGLEAAAIVGQVPIAFDRGLCPNKKIGQNRLFFRSAGEPAPAAKSLPGPERSIPIQQNFLKGRQVFVNRFLSPSTSREFGISDIAHGQF